MKWTKFANFDKVKSVLEQKLNDDDARKLVYHLSDGKNTRETIAKLTIVSTQTVSNWWKSWAKIGVIELKSVQGGERGSKVFELEDFDIPIPKLPEKKTEEPAK